MGDLVFAYWDDQRFAGVGIHDDVGGLEGGIAEEAVGVEIFVLDVVEGFFVGGDAFEPAERRNHGEEEMQFGVFDDLRLLEDGGFGGVETGGEVVDGDLQHVLGDRRSISVIGGERVPVSDEVEAIVRRIGLKLDPVLQRPEVVADVQPTSGAHAGENAFGGGGGQVGGASVNWDVVRRKRITDNRDRISGGGEELLGEKEKLEEKRGKI